MTLTRFSIKKKAAPVIKGCMHNVLIVKHPPPPFREAIFILREDAGIDRDLLLKEANQCIQNYLKGSD